MRPASLADAEGAGLIVLGVGLGQVALAGGGVLFGNLHDGLLDGQRAAGEVDVAGLERDQLAAPQSGLDQGLDHQSVLGGHRGQETLVLEG